MLCEAYRRASGSGRPLATSSALTTVSNAPNVLVSIKMPCTRDSGDVLTSATGTFITVRTALTPGRVLIASLCQVPADTIMQVWTALHLAKVQKQCCEQTVAQACMVLPDPIHRFYATSPAAPALYCTAAVCDHPGPPDKSLPYEPQGDAHPQDCASSRKPLG